jgi:hypothetical protein
LYHIPDATSASIFYITPSPMFLVPWLSELLEELTAKYKKA